MTLDEFETIKEGGIVYRVDLNGPVVKLLTASLTVSPDLPGGRWLLRWGDGDHNCDPTNKRSLVARWHLTPKEAVQRAVYVRRAQLREAMEEVTRCINWVEALGPLVNGWLDVNPRYFTMYDGTSVMVPSFSVIDAVGITFETGGDDD